MSIISWKKIKEQVAYSGWRSILVKTFHLPNGQEQSYDIVRNGSYVVVAAFTKHKEAILIRQYRPGPEMVLSSFCEGYIDQGETPEQAARRELLEETGYRVGSIQRLRTLHTAYSTEQRICLLATDCEYERPPAGDADEFIEVGTMPLTELLSWVRTDKSAFYTLDALFLALQTDSSLRVE